MRDIFVFGSNEAGRHGKGAAKFALEHHGAKYGIGVGLQGNAYAIPTKDKNLRRLSLEQIQEYVWEFIEYARKCNYLRFNVTPIGCGLAGYRPSQIGPMFIGHPDNVVLDIKLRKAIQ